MADEAAHTVTLHRRQDGRARLNTIAAGSFQRAWATIASVMITARPTAALRRRCLQLLPSQCSVRFPLDTTAERLRFDAPHELGHLCIHCTHAVPHGREAEAAANQFASALLKHRDDVLSVGLRNPSVAQIIRAQARWNVSATALANRLHALGLITDWTYRAALVELGKRGFRSARPGSALVHESSQVLGEVLAGLRGQGMTVRDIAKSSVSLPKG
ncbi:ImmA/IrrE family metallo-endopeptidase [Nocardia fluminea]|uniref:ImmA/IrrE family metallo-endopeptidase n=1 Tax=Nocardia fluminea TaxID=134984 RepID=UPI003F4D70A4